MKKILFIYTMTLLLVYPFSFSVCAEKSEKEIFFDNAAENRDKRSASPEEISRIGEIIGFFGLKEGETVLDAGCGSGRLTPFLLNRVGQNGHVYGIDFSQEMLRIAKQRYLNGNVSFIKADLVKIPLPSENIDRIITSIQRNLLNYWNSERNSFPNSGLGTQLHRKLCFH